MPQTICPTCNTPHEPNGFAPYCRSRCQAFGLRQRAVTKPRPYSAADAERAQLRREVTQLRVTVDTQAALLAGCQRQVTDLQRRCGRLTALVRRLRNRFLHPRRYR